MRRYSAYVHGDLKASHVEDSGGDYVRYEDAAAEIKEWMEIAQKFCDSRQCTG